MRETPFDLLGRQLEAAARRQLSAGAPRRRRRVPVLLAATLAALLLAAAAWAARSVIAPGVPVGYRFGKPVSGSGFGTPVPGSVALLTETVPDPAGGLSWGLRTFTTTRGYACVQVGRIYRGALGLIGRDGAFANDGRFHELRPGVVLDRNECFPLDGSGHAYLAVHENDVPASGPPAACAAGPLLPAPEPTCAPADLRSLDFGLLGPAATDITYRAGGRTVSGPVLGPVGGYLIVQRRQPAQTVGTRLGQVQSGSYLVSLTPESPVIEKVDYGAKACLVHPASGALGGCTDPPGFVAVPQPKVTAVRTPVRATPIGRRAIRVRFRARLGVTSGRSAYDVTVFAPTAATYCGVAGPGPPAPAEARCDATYGTSVARDVSAGGQLTQDVSLIRRLPGRYRVVVSYRTQPPRPKPGGSLTYPGTIVGRAAVDVP